MTHAALGEIIYMHDKYVPGHFCQYNNIHTYLLPVYKMNYDDEIDIRPVISDKDYSIKREQNVLYFRVSAVQQTIQNEGLV